MPDRPPATLTSLWALFRRAPHTDVFNRRAFLIRHAAVVKHALACPWARGPVEAITRRDVETLRLSLIDSGRQECTAGQVVSTISVLFRFGQRRGLVDFNAPNPCDKIPRGSSRRLDEFYRDDEVRLLYELALCLGDRSMGRDRCVMLYPWLVTLAHTAWRKGELFGATLDDVIWRDGVVVGLQVQRSYRGPRPKGTRPNDPLPPPTPLGPFPGQVLADWIAVVPKTPERLLFPVSGGRKRRTWRMGDSHHLIAEMRWILDAAGLRQLCRPVHALRHTAITHAQAQGLPERQAQQLARHADREQTERYTHIVEAEKLAEQLQGFEVGTGAGRIRDPLGDLQRGMQSLQTELGDLRAMVAELAQLIRGRG